MDIFLNNKEPISVNMKNPTKGIKWPLQKKYMFGKKKKLHFGGVSFGLHPWATITQPS
jgi:hypothetical protein